MRISETHQLKHYLHADIIGLEKKFSWGRVIRRLIRNPSTRYIFRWRIASYLFNKEGKWSKKIANRMNRNLVFHYGIEIELGAIIAPGITFAHYQGIVISRACIIGDNFHIRQNTTIGVKTGNNSKITIGNNVEIGSNSCIIGDNIKIGNNVTIGAMSFVNKDIPDNCIVYTEKKMKIKIKQEAL